MLNDDLPIATTNEELLAFVMVSLAIMMILMIILYIIAMIDQKHKKEQEKIQKLKIEEWKKARQAKRS